MNLYLDASALVKRYVAEKGSGTVADAMQRANTWLIARHGFVETARAVGLASGRTAIRAFESEWPSFSVVELDQALCDNAVRLALEHDLRSLDATHLAAALLLPQQHLVFATWDRRLSRAAKAEGLEVLPEQ